MNKSIYLRYLLLLLLTWVGGWTAKGETYQLITSVDQLEANARYLIVSSDKAGTAYSLGVKNDKNRGQDTITISSNLEIEFDENMTALVLGGSSDGWTFYDNANKAYLNATSTTGSNYLRTVATLDKYWTCQLLLDKS